MDEKLNSLDWMDPYAMAAQQQRKPIPKKTLTLLKTGAKQIMKDAKHKKELVQKAASGHISSTLATELQKTLTQYAGKKRPADLDPSTPASKKHGPRRPHVSWGTCLHLMLEKDFDMSAKSVTDLMASTGYSRGRLFDYKNLFIKGEYPCQTQGRPQRMSDELQLVLKEVFANRSVYDEHFGSVLQKASLLLHKADPAYESRPWTPLSPSTVYRIDKKMGTTTRTAQVQDERREKAGADEHGLGSMIGMFGAARMLGGMTCQDQGERAEQRVFNPRWMWNFDASGGRTLGYDAKIKTVKGAAAKKVQGKTGLPQMYNHITAVNALGQVIPP